MGSQTLPVQYTIAAGPEGLNNVLKEFSDKAERDPAFASQPHYILYQLGSQQSLIKAVMDGPPYQFLHYDLLGRPATRIVQESIAKYGMLYDESREQLVKAQKPFLKLEGDWRVDTGDIEPPTLQNAYNHIKDLHRAPLEPVAVAPERSDKKLSSAKGRALLGWSVFNNRQKISGETPAKTPPDVKNSGPNRKL